MTNGFRFRQFSVNDDRCAMRVGTDGILLGAWVYVNNATRILDIGTGCGLIALMMAQRNSKALIDAIEIDTEAAEQASENVAESPWSDRIEVFNISLENYVGQAENAGRYDLIVCNPPFFSKSSIPQDIRKSTARHEQRITFTQLFASVTTMLQSGGRLAMIVPFGRLANVVDLAKSHNLALTKTTEVSPMPVRQPNRLLVELGHDMTSPMISSRLEIYRQAGVYSDEYCAMTRDFYLPETFFSSGGRPGGFLR